MNLSGIKGLASMAVIVLLVSGCSSQSKPEYDPLEILEYEQCLEAKMEHTEWERIPAPYFKEVWDGILKVCKAYKPTKQE